MSKKNKYEKKRVPARVPIKTIEAAQKYAKRHDMRLCDVIDEAILFYLELKEFL